MMRKNDNGFTLIEVLVTIVIMAILMGVALVSMRGYQANARDEERRTDIANIARGLENYYTDGDPTHGIGKGHYPSSTEVDAAYGAVPPYITTQFLPGVTVESFRDPLGGSSNFYYDPARAGGTYSSAYARTLLSSTPYLYQPLTRSDTFCTNWINCDKYNLYYLTEADNTVHTVRSKNQ